MGSHSKTAPPGGRGLPVGAAVSPEALKALTTPDARKFTAWLVFHALLYAAGVSLVAWLENPFLLVLVSVFLGSGLHAFTILQHDCGHESAYRSKTANLWVGRVLAWFIVMPFTTFTAIHKRHHAYLGDPEKDPDEWFYAGGPFSVFIREWLFLPRFLKESLTSKFRPETRKRVVREFVFNVASWGCIVALCAFLGALQFLFFAWFLPLAILSLIISPISRGYEHYPMTYMDRSDETRRSLRHNTITISNRLISFFWANITYHVEHHLYPRVPFYRLPAVHRLLEGVDYIVEPYPLYQLPAGRHHEAGSGEDAPHSLVAD